MDLADYPKNTPKVLRAMYINAPDRNPDRAVKAQTIADLIDGVTKRSVIYVLDKLRDDSLVRVVRERDEGYGNPTKYWLLMPPAHREAEKQEAFSDVYDELPEDPNKSDIQDVVGELARIRDIDKLDTLSEPPAEKTTVEHLNSRIEKLESALNQIKETNEQLRQELRSVQSDRLVKLEEQVSAINQQSKKNTSADSETIGDSKIEEIHQKLHELDQRAPNEPLEFILPAKAPREVYEDTYTHGGLFDMYELREDFYTDIIIKEHIRQNDKVYDGWIRASCGPIIEDLDVDIDTAIESAVEYSDKIEVSELPDDDYDEYECEWVGD